MENMCVAIEKIKYLQSKPVFRKHTRVVQVNIEETLETVAFNVKLNEGLRNGMRYKDSKNESRKFKCLDCGAVWTDNIHAPLFMTAAEVNVYYPQSINCLTLK